MSYQFLLFLLVCVCIYKMSHGREGNVSSPVRCLWEHCCPWLLCSHLSLWVFKVSVPSKLIYINRFSRIWRTQSTRLTYLLTQAWLKVLLQGLFWFLIINTYRRTHQHSNWAILLHYQNAASWSKSLQDF